MFAGDGIVPNNPKLPIIVLPAAAQAFERVSRVALPETCPIMGDAEPSVQFRTRL